MRFSLAVVCVLALTAHAADAPAPLRGYTPADSATEIQWEKKFRELPDPAPSARTCAACRRGHITWARRTTRTMRSGWCAVESFGLDAQIEKFTALFPTPKLRTLELLGPTKFTAKLQEPPLSVDPTSSQTSEQLPTYNAYSRDGDVTLRWCM